MAAGWAKAKVIKLKKQRRAWARPFRVKSGIEPNREVVRQYQDTAKGLGKDIAQVRFPNIAPGRREMMDRINTIGDPLRGIHTDIKDPLFVNIQNNTRQRCRLFWNSQLTVFILQWVHWEKGWVRLSIQYSNSAKAKSAWETDRVIWKKEFPLRK